MYFVLLEFCNSFRRTTHVRHLGNKLYFIGNQGLGIFTVKLVLCCTWHGDVNLDLPWLLAFYELRAGELLRIRLNYILVGCSQFKHVVNLLTAETCRVINITIRPGDCNNLGTKLGGLKGCTPCHVAETGYCHCLAL
ncbi:MAG: hypothetical protein BWY89_01545 [Bacteroidetes bacterium ADurb.BinA012]|nr:MAG: hypothetical protein BWY89_01545 [Bacteroidetes bacterium ADurb.BinA012]